MIRTLLALAIAAIITCGAAAQNGVLVIYRPKGKNLGVMHYGQGEHPTIVCDGRNIAKIAQDRKAKIEAAPGQHMCSANEKQLPVENGNSDTIPVDVKPNQTTYLRLESHIGHVHFVLKKVPAQTGAAEAKTMKPANDEDVYIQVLLANKMNPLCP